jgi:hypothetical protein
VVVVVLQAQYQPTLAALVVAAPKLELVLARLVLAQQAKGLQEAIINLHHLKEQAVVAAGLEVSAVMRQIPVRLGLAAQDLHHQ